MSATEGYHEAAEHFQSEANVEPGATASTLQERMQVREAVQSGEIENAVQLINSHFPGVLLSNDELRFQLQARMHRDPIVTYYYYYYLSCVVWWLSGMALDVRFTGRGFNSQLVCFHVT